jgi:hypothetical protein
MGESFTCDNLPHAQMPRPARLSAILYPVIALSEMGLFFTIWQIFCAA